ncbi:hypothetical protein [Rickettsia australis]|uniref:hypothetical protein n=1 Tax=Rickettsia australis TaxID=787 RepID=UPI00030370D3|nr:hypothetical protein [Rickettsia australis]
MLAEESSEVVGTAKTVKQQALHVSQLLKRNIWQWVFKGKIVDAEKITILSANASKVSTFFSSEESNNYVKYLEATGKGGVAHDYLKYDSFMYQDMFTNLAMRDERLSGNIKELSNSISKQNQTQDISSNSTTSIETIGTKTKLIDDTQNLYEKKVLEYDSTAGTYAVYRDYLELMVQNFGESHEKVTLYKNIVRDVSIPHSAQLGMNINDLPDSHHKEIARDVYSTISEYHNRYALDAADKNKIANAVYEEHCSLKAWEQKSYEQVTTSYKVYADYQERLEQIKYTTFNYEFVDLGNKLLNTRNKNFYLN